MGGFAVTQASGFARVTADIELASVIPYAGSGRLLAVAGAGSPLWRRHRVYVELVSVSAAPESYESS